MVPRVLHEDPPARVVRAGAPGLRAPPPCGHGSRTPWRAARRRHARTRAHEPRRDRRARRRSLRQLRERVRPRLRRPPVARSRHQADPRGARHLDGAVHEPRRPRACHDRRRHVAQEPRHERGHVMHRRRPQPQRRLHVGRHAGPVLLPTVHRHLRRPERLQRARDAQRQAPARHAPRRHVRRRALVLRAHPVAVGACPFADDGPLEAVHDPADRHLPAHRDPRLPGVHPAARPPAVPDRRRADQGRDQGRARAHLREPGGRRPLPHHGNPERLRLQPPHRELAASARPTASPSRRAHGSARRRSRSIPPIPSR